MDKPPNTKTTTQMEAPPDWAIALTQKVVTGFSEVEKRLDAMEANIDIQKSAVQDVMTRMSRVEDRQNHNSLRAQSASQVDLKHEVAIATLVTDVEGMKKDMTRALGILDKLDAVAANPLVRRIAYAAGSLVLLYLGAVATRLQAKADAAPPGPMHVIVDHVADGGAR